MQAAAWQCEVEFGVRRLAHGDKTARKRPKTVRPSTCTALRSTPLGPRGGGPQHRTRALDVKLTPRGCTYPTG